MNTDKLLYVLKYAIINYMSQDVNKDIFKISHRPGRFKGELISGDKRMVQRNYSPSLNTERLIRLLDSLVGKTIAFYNVDNNIVFDVSGNGCRTASSLFSGAEAYEGEKDGMAIAMGELVGDLVNEGFYDSSLSLESFGVTREASPRYFFIPSPNLCETSDMISEDLFDEAMTRLVSDMDRLRIDD